MVNLLFGTAAAIILINVIVASNKQRSISSSQILVLRQGHPPCERQLAMTLLDKQKFYNSFKDFVAYNTDCVHGYVETYNQGVNGQVRRHMMLWFGVYTGSATFVALIATNPPLAAAVIGLTATLGLGVTMILWDNKEVIVAVTEAAKAYKDDFDYLLSQDLTDHTVHEFDNLAQLMILKIIRAAFMVSEH